MFTLKLYRATPDAPEGQTVIVETAGLWVGRCPGGVNHIQAFKQKVGVMDEDGTPEFYVGGTVDLNSVGCPESPPPAIRFDNYYTWGVLENAMGKTTEMFR